MHTITNEFDDEIRDILSDSVKKYFSKEIEAWTKEFSDEMNKYKLAGKELGKKKDIKDEQDKKARKSTKDKAEEPEQEVDDSEEEDVEKDA